MWAKSENIASLRSHREASGEVRAAFPDVRAETVLANLTSWRLREVS